MPPCWWKRLLKYVLLLKPQSAAICAKLLSGPFLQLINQKAARIIILHSQYRLHQNCCSDNCY